MIKENIASDGKFDSKAGTIRRRLDWLVAKPDKIQQAARAGRMASSFQLGLQDEVFGGQISRSFQQAALGPPSP